MPVTRDQAAPYAPAKAIMSLIERHRERGLPAPVDNETLGRAGISASLRPRTLQALHALDLIDDAGQPTETFEGLRLAPQAEFAARLQEWLNGAYADALAFVDPAKDDETKIRDAFRSYKPIGQQGRMVTLFIGLYSAAGVRAEKDRQASPRPRVPTSSPRPTKTAQKPPSRDESVKPRATPPVSSLPPALAGLLASLPEAGTWTKTERDRFVQTFGAVLDFCFPVVPMKQKAPQVKEEEANDEA